MIRPFKFLALIGILTWSCQNADPQPDKNIGNAGKSPSLATAVSQTDQIGGRCEDCEAVNEYGERKLSWTDTLEDFHLTGPKISVSGTIFLPDGKTPAQDVILYLYHTDQTGVYPVRDDVTGAGRRHGYLRTWLKTDSHGRYQFFTLRPASYPGSRNPAHIHAIVKEPAKQPYWIDDFLFDDDPFLTKEQRGYVQGRGGDQGILRDGKAMDGVMMYRRDIVLGINIEGY